LLSNITKPTASEDLVTIVCDNITDTFLTVWEELKTLPPLEAPSLQSEASLGANGEPVKKCGVLPENLLRLQAACKAVEILCVQWQANTCEAYRLRMPEMRRPLLALFKLYTEAEDTRLSAHASLFDALVLVCPSESLPERDERELLSYKSMLDGFVQKWDEYVPLKLNQCIAVQNVLVRIFGTMIIADTNLPGPLLEILHEVLTDERHGVSEEGGMVRKILEVITSLAHYDKQVFETKHSIADDVAELLSDWRYRGDAFHLRVTLQLFSAMADCDDHTRKHLCMLFPKLDGTLDLFGHEQFILR
jgi:hypothetical protein